MTDALIYTFLASFFTFVSAREWWTREDEYVRARLGRVLTPKAKASQEILLKRKKESARSLWFKRVSLVIPLFSVLTLFFLDLSIGMTLLLSAILLVLFVLLPRAIYLHGFFKRRREMERNLPDALDLLILCLEAGLSFDVALYRVAEEEKRVSQHLSQELLTAHHEILAGEPREEALRNLARRTAVADLHALVGAILQSIKFGTSLVKTMKVQAEAIRKKRRERIRAQILKTPVKLVFPLLFFIFPTLLIVILGPSLVEIFRHLNDVSM